jgi:hypothetical protein
MACSNGRCTENLRGTRTAQIIVVLANAIGSLIALK